MITMLCQAQNTFTNAHLKKITRAIVVGGANCAIFSYVNNHSKSYTNAIVNNIIKQEKKGNLTGKSEEVLILNFENSWKS